MNKATIKGFAAGVVSSIAALSLVFSAMAASRTIVVDEGMKISINGARFLPKDPNGNAVGLFSYNGTTYAPVRAICEAAGLKVGYDESTQTAIITTPDRAWAENPSASGYITLEKAKQIALDDAGVKASDVVFLKARIDWDDAEYEIEFYRGGVEYDYDIDAATGKINSADRDADDFDIHIGSNGTGSENLISTARAQQIALDRAPTGTTVVSCELDRDDGRYVYEIKMRNGTTEYECDVNAVTGTILDWDVDHDD